MFGEQLMRKGSIVVQSDTMQYYKSNMDRISPTGLPQEKFILDNWSEWVASEEYQNILTAKRYLKNRNDIKDRKRLRIGRMGEQLEDKLLANNKLSHAFLNKLTRQKTSYLLAKPFTINANNDTYAKILNDILGTAEFRKKLIRITKEAIYAGKSWIQVYYDDQGELVQGRIPPEEVLPFWKDSDHTELEAVIRRYTVTYYQLDKKEIIEKYEFWFEGGVYYYQKDGNELIPDPDVIENKGTNLLGHFEVDVTPVDEEPDAPRDIKQSTWNKIPIIPFKYNAEEMSLLDLVKSLIDDYDSRTSDNSNQIEDIPNSITLVRGYEGTDPGEFIENIKNYRMAFVNETGDMSSVPQQLGIQDSEPHLTRLRKDIYEFGFGVDTQSKETGNSSGVALKFLYADLDMDAADLGNELSTSLQSLIEFINIDLLNRGVGDFTNEKVEIIFNTDITINETETIDNLTKSGSILSKETILENHPYVSDAQYEMGRIDKEEEAERKKYEDQYSNSNQPFPGDDEPEEDEE